MSTVALFVVRYFLMGDRQVYNWGDVSSIKGVDYADVTAEYKKLREIGLK